MPALLYEKRDGIAYLTFNRPEVHNAWNPEVFCRLADAWADFAEDDLLRVAIITGAGDKAFIAAGNGFCLAGGAELLQGTDIRIAAEHATFGLSESKRALVPGGGSMVRRGGRGPATEGGGGPR